MTAAYILTVVLLSPADKGLDCIVCNVRTYIATSTKLVCHICTQQRCSTEKDEHVNWVKTNPWTLKSPSAERGDIPRGSYTEGHSVYHLFMSELQDVCTHIAATDHTQRNCHG